MVRLAATARCDLPHPVQTFLLEAFPPEPGRVPAYSKLRGNLQVLFAFRRPKNDSRPQGNRLGCGLRTLQLFKLNAVYVRQRYRQGGFGHERDHESKSDYMYGYI